MVVYLIAQDSHGGPCVVPVSAHYHLHVTNVGVGPYDYYPGQDILKQVQASGIALPLQIDLEKTTRTSDHNVAEGQINKMIGR